MNVRKINLGAANFFLFILATLSLLVFAFYNKYPIIFSDVGTYVSSGFYGRVPVDRPIFYGLFVRHISLATSLWFVVMAQSLLTVMFILYLVKYVFKSDYAYLKTFIASMALSLTTSVSYVVSHVMPDFFFFILIAGMVILILEKNLPVLQKIILSILIVYACMAHLANLLISVALIITILTVQLVFIKKTFFRKRIRNTLLVAGVLASVWVIMPSINYMYDAGFKMSRTKNIFIVANLIESGILKNYLVEYCKEKEYPICNGLENLPERNWLFLWKPNSPLYQNCNNMNDCWFQKDKEYEALISDIFSVPKYRKKIIGIALKNSFKQIVSFDLDGREHIHENHPSWRTIEIHLNNDFNYYKASRQGEQKIYFNTISIIQKIIVLISLVIISIFMALKSLRKHIPDKAIAFIGIIFITILLNSFVTASLSAVVNRYQNRIIWVIPFIAIILLLDLVVKWRTRKKSFEI
jgi:hypothetical protein